MNSKLFWMLALLLISACGVKGDPVAPKDVVLPSLIDNYPDIKINEPLGDTRKFK